MTQCSTVTWHRSYLLSCLRSTLLVSFFFFNATATTEIYTLSLHDALPISRLLTLLVILTMPLFLARLTLIPIKAADRKSGSAGMPRPISYAVFCLKKKRRIAEKDGPA